MFKVGEFSMKVLCIFGTRPEAIKMCPLIIELKSKKCIDTKVCLTGQHKEMLEQVMEIFNIKADYNLDIMQENQDLFSITNKVMTGIRKLLEVEKPSVVLVHGDTTTSFAAGLAAFYERIPIGHVEAGLRTYNTNSPFPEEFNRQAVDALSNIYFAPTQWAKENLLRECKNEDAIFVTGNTVIDAMKNTINSNYVDENIRWASDSKMILLTTHRRENIGKPMRNIFRACNRITQDFDEVKIIFPIHKNPKVRALANEEIGTNNRIRIIDTLDVVTFHNYMNHAYLIMSDSGGVQEEAPALDIPVIVLRNTTERPEGVEAGTLRLAGVNENDIYENVKKLLVDENEYNSMKNAKNPYGDGKASERIVNILCEKYGNKS